VIDGLRRAFETGEDDDRCNACKPGSVVIQVAAALDSSPPLKPLVQAVANLTIAGTLQAFDALSGEMHGSVQTTMIDDSRYMRS
jgi:uncharacterized protein with beta-barrel porin domain